MLLGAIKDNMDHFKDIKHITRSAASAQEVKDFFVPENRAKSIYDNSTARRNARWVKESRERIAELSKEFGESDPQIAFVAALARANEWKDFVESRSYSYLCDDSNEQIQINRDATDAQCKALNLVLGKYKDLYQEFLFIARMQMTEVYDGNGTFRESWITKENNPFNDVLDPDFFSAEEKQTIKDIWEGHITRHKEFYKNNSAKQLIESTKSREKLLIDLEAKVDAYRKNHALVSEISEAQEAVEVLYSNSTSQDDVRSNLFDLISYAQDCDPNKQHSECYKDSFNYFFLLKRASNPFGAE